MSRINDHHHSPLAYSSNMVNVLNRSQQGAAGEPNRVPENTAQWTCYKCFINNFNGRANCFKCGTPQASGDTFALDAKGLSMVGALPCDTLLLRELPTSATDSSIRHAVVHFAGIDPLRVRMAASRMFAFIQMASLVDAEIAHQKLQRMCLYIDNCAVFVSFSRHSLNAVLSDGHIKLLAETQQDAPDTSLNSSTSSTVNTPFGTLPIFPVPDPPQLQFEPSSGYYYDQTTGFYYDPKTEFYYSPKSKSWKFWCQQYRTYIDCEGGDITLKRRLQEDERQKRHSDGKTHVDAGPPSMAEHRHALRNAPPPPNPNGGSSNKTVTAKVIVPSSKTHIGTDDTRRPLLLELEDDDDNDAIQTVAIGRAREEGGRKMRWTDERNGEQRKHLAKHKMVVEHKIADDVRPDNEILMLDATKAVPPSSSLPSSSTNNNASLMQTLRESMRLNHIVIRQLSAQRSSAKDRHQIGSLQAQIDALLSQQQALDASIEQLICYEPSSSRTNVVEQQQHRSTNAADGVLHRHRSGSPSGSVKQMRQMVDGGSGGGSSRRFVDNEHHRVTPQFKRHITKEQTREMGQRSPSIVDLDEHEEDEAAATHRSSAKHQAYPPSPKRSSSSSWRDKTKRTQSSPSVRDESDHGRFHHHASPIVNQCSPPVTREDLGQLVSALVKRGIDEEWRNFRKRHRSRSRSQSPPHGKRDEHWREGRESDRRSRRHDERRSRSRDRSRERQRQQQLPGQEEPMTIEDSPSPPPALIQGQTWGSSTDNNGGIRMPMFPPFPMRHGLPPFNADPAAGHAGLMPSPMMTPNMMIQNLIRHNISQPPFFVPTFKSHEQLHHQQLMLRAPSVQMNPTPGVPLGYMAPSNLKQFFNNNNPLREQQLRYPAALSSAAARVMPQSAFNSGSSGGSPFNRRGAQPAVVFNQLLDNADQGQKKSQLISKERDKVNNLGICLNCGRHGHSLFHCRWNRISDDELQKKLREAKQKLQRQELDKQELKRKAEKYPLRRKDPLIERLRVAAPHGKIKMEHIRIMCLKCAHFNHTRMECSRPDIGRSLYKQISSQLEEFKKVFFVHLQEDKMIDFSQKFDTFRVMDGIERNGTIDPVGLQLQALCPDGIVTQMDLRELCSNCAQLGHKKTECADKTECSRTHFDKMLDMVKAYRALVKEGNGNCVLPTAKMMNPPVLVLKDIERSEPIEEITLLDSSDDDEIVVEQQHQQNGKECEKTQQKDKTEDEKQSEHGKQQHHVKEKEGKEKEDETAPEMQNGGEENCDSANADVALGSSNSTADDQSVGVMECIEKILSRTTELSTTYTDCEMDNDIEILEEIDDAEMDDEIGARELEREKEKGAEEKEKEEEEKKKKEAAEKKKREAEEKEREEKEKKEAEEREREEKEKKEAEEREKQVEEEMETQGEKEKQAEKKKQNESKEKQVEREEEKQVEEEKEAKEKEEKGEEAEKQAEVEKEKQGGEEKETQNNKEKEPLFLDDEEQRKEADEVMIL